MFYNIHGVRALIFNNKKLLILKRAFSDSNDSGLWDIPGGSVGDGEKIFDALNREVLEETGIKFRLIKNIDICGLIFCEIDKNIKISILLYKCISNTSTIKLSNEHSEFRWIHPGRINNYKPCIVLKAIKSSMKTILEF